jgi:hypothetical protein
VHVFRLAGTLLLVPLALPPVETKGTWQPASDAATAAAAIAHRSAGSLPMFAPLSHSFVPDAVVADRVVTPAGS